MIEAVYEGLKSCGGANGKYLSDNTVANIFRIFKSVWRFGTENGYPCCDYKAPRIKTKRLNDILVLLPEALETIESIKASIILLRNEKQLRYDFLHI